MDHEHGQGGQAVGSLLLPSRVQPDWDFGHLINRVDPETGGVLLDFANGLGLGWRQQGRLLDLGDIVRVDEKARSRKDPDKNLRSTPNTNLSPSPMNKAAKKLTEKRY